MTYALCTLCEVCKMKNIFLELRNRDINFCPGFIGLHIFYKNVHLHKHSNCSLLVINYHLVNSVIDDNKENVNYLIR